MQFQGYIIPFSSNGLYTHQYAFSLWGAAIASHKISTSVGTTRGQGIIRVVVVVVVVLGLVYFFKNQFFQFLHTNGRRAMGQGETVNGYRNITSKE